MSQVREEIGYVAVKKTRDAKEDPRSFEEIRVALGWQRLSDEELDKKRNGFKENNG